MNNTYINEDRKLENIDQSRIMNNVHINNEIDRSYLPMIEQSKLNSANHSIFGIDSNTSRFMLPDTTANSRRDMMFMEDQEKDISAIHRLNDHTNMQLNHDYD